MNADNTKRLYIRLDRLGDLILSLPVDYKDSDSQWIIPKGLSWVVQRSEKVRKFKEVHNSFSWSEFKDLLSWIKKEKFEEAIVFHAPWWIGLVLFLSGVKKRICRKSQWHSFLFYNHGLRQKRSRAELHELEYNYELRFLHSDSRHNPGNKESLMSRLETLGINPEHSLKLNPKENLSLFSSWNLISGSYIVVHPGMGGSALNLTAGKYAELIRSLSENQKVVITGTKGDWPYIEPIKNILGESSSSIIWLNEKLNGLELIDVVGKAKGVIAPSTGVLHVAASTGVPTVGIFSPVRVQSYKRWGPRGKKVSHTEANVPKCPGTLSCLRQECEYFNCMDRIKVSQIEKKLDSLVQDS